MADRIPEHVFIIPDGNRRWAKRWSLSPYAGHKEGVKTFQAILREALQLGIPYVTCWALSRANVLNRSNGEVWFLFRLFGHSFRWLASSREIQENKVRVRFLGRWQEYCPLSLRKAIEYCSELTKEHNNFHLTILICYSGLDEMEDAIRRMVSHFTERPGEIPRGAIKDFLWTRELPPVDLVIRTGGEPHWSEGALMWDAAEARFYFTETLWPDFSVQEFRSAIDWYAGIEKRRGA